MCLRRFRQPRGRGDPRPPVLPPCAQLRAAVFPRRVVDPKGGVLGLLKAIREYDPGRDAAFRTFADTCIRNRLCTALRAASAGKHSPLNQSVPLHPAFFDANTAFAQVDPEVLLIDREKTANLLDSAHKLLSEFEVKVLGFYLDGLTCREISETVGKSPKSVDNAVQRIRRKIARQLSSGDISKS